VCEKGGINREQPPFYIIDRWKEESRHSLLNEGKLGLPGVGLKKSK